MASHASSPPYSSIDRPIQLILEYFYLMGWQMKKIETGPGEWLGGKGEGLGVCERKNLLRSRVCVCACVCVFVRVLGDLVTTNEPVTQTNGILKILKSQLATHETMQNDCRVDFWRLWRLVCHAMCASVILANGLLKILKSRRYSGFTYSIA